MKWFRATLAPSSKKLEQWCVGLGISWEVVGHYPHFSHC